MDVKNIKKELLKDFEQAIINVITEYDFALTSIEMVRIINKIVKLL